MKQRVKFLRAWTIEGRAFEVDTEHELAPEIAGLLRDAGVAEFVGGAPAASGGDGATFALSDEQFAEMMGRVMGAPTDAEVEAERTRLAGGATPPVAASPATIHRDGGPAIHAREPGDFNERMADRELNFRDFGTRRDLRVQNINRQVARAIPRPVVELTEQMFRTLGNHDVEARNNAVRLLFEMGAYRDVVPQTRDGYSTLTEQSGAVLIPTVISNIVFDIAGVYGTVPRWALQLPLTGNVKIPRLAGAIVFYAVNEHSEAKASRTSFEGILLRAREFVATVPWTLKMNREAGQRLIPIITRKLGEGLALLLDDIAYNADGTSTYHQIKGILQAAIDTNVSYATAASGNVSFATLDAEDWLDLRDTLPASLRHSGVFGMHPDRETELLKLQDGQGMFIYGGPAIRRGGPLEPETLWGRPMSFSEKAPNTDSTSEEYAVYFDPDFLAYGTGQGLTTRQLTEATILDDDGSTQIRLASYRMMAIQAVLEADLDLGDYSAFAVGRTAAS